MNVRRSVFLLEDEPELAKLVQLHLERADFKVSAFSTAKGFVSAAREQQPSLFLLDIMVPGGDGREVCSQIRDSEALAHTPVIFLTARASEADRLQGFGLG
ncbi:MAG TPA: response regulator, partial [Terriglobales bacterium]